MAVVTKRAEIARRARTLAPMQSIPYSQSLNGRPPNWPASILWEWFRWDCSGFVSWVLGLLAPGLSTVSLPSVCTKLASWDLAEPGDLWGKMGPRTAGTAGHVAVIVDTPRTHPQGKWVIIDHGGGSAGGSSYGPDIRTFSSPPSEYSPWRFNPTMEGTMSLGDRELAQGASGADVAELQTALGRLGYSVGATGADGQFGPATADAVRRFQAAQGLTVDGVCGPKTVAAIRSELGKLDQAEKLAELRPFIMAVFQEQAAALRDSITAAVVAAIRPELRAELASQLSAVQVVGQLRLPDEAPPA